MGVDSLKGLELAKKVAQHVQDLHLTFVLHSGDSGDVFNSSVNEVLENGTIHALIRKPANIQVIMRTIAIAVRKVASAKGGIE